MYMKKTYGQNMTKACPFCGAAAYAKNKDGVPVCANHKHATLGEMKCVCGSFLEQKTGKWGAFFVCETCGPVNMKKALSVNDVQAPAKKVERARGPKKDEWGNAVEEVVRPDDPRYFS